MNKDIEKQLSKIKSKIEYDGNTIHIRKQDSIDFKVGGFYKLKVRDNFDLPDSLLLVKCVGVSEDSISVASRVYNGRIVKKAIEYVEEM
jgi:hypothetical protein